MIEYERLEPDEVFLKPKKGCSSASRLLCLILLFTKQIVIEPHVMYINECWPFNIFYKPIMLKTASAIAVFVDCFLPEMSKSKELVYFQSN